MPDFAPPGGAAGVRQARESEWRPYRALRLKALEQDPLAFGSTLSRERAFSEADWRERIARGTTTLASATFVAVDERGRFVGMVVAAVVGDEPHLFGMWVEPERRGEGIGAQLVDASLAWISRAHAGRPVLLEVNPTMAAAVRLYESRGFRRTGKDSPLGHTAGERVVEMRRAPAPPEARAQPVACTRADRPSDRGGTGDPSRELPRARPPSKVPARHSEASPT